MRNVRPFYFATLAAVALSFFASPSFAEITRLTVDARVVPTIGVDSTAPEFGWELATDRFFNVEQTRYSLEVSSSREALESGQADMWKSGEVASSRSFGVAYEGKPLSSSQRYFWRVTASWSGVDVAYNKVEKTESAIGEFVTGVMSADEWRANWITCERTNADPTPVFFRNFTLDQKKENVVEGFLHVCGLGQQIVSVNSIRVSDHSSVDPGWTNYKKSCLYTTFDVKKELTSSDDCSVSVALGNGMYNVPGGRYVKFQGSFGLPQLIARLVVRYRDGSVQTIVSDENWQTLFSPIVFSCVYGGDDVDFTTGVVSKNRIMARGKPSQAIKSDGPVGVLKAQIQPPVVVWETLKPISVKTLDNGLVEANFGFNFAGRPVFRCVPRDGSKVVVTLAEMEGKPWNGHSDSYQFAEPNAVDAEKGEIVLETARVPEAPVEGFDEELRNLTIRPDEKFSSIFGYWGFQYAYFDGAEFEPNLEKALEKNSAKTQIVGIEADRIGADLERVGSFESDGAYLNDIELMVDRSVRSNIVSLMTDCPHREKLGWLEETHLMGPSILYRYNLQTLFRKVCQDMAEAQLDDGMIPDIAPEYTRFVQGFFWSAEWSSACVQLPWLLYRWYGDEQTFAVQYETMNKYVRYMASIRDDKGLVKAGLGDWYDWSPERSHAGYSQHTPGELTATAFLCDNARIMAVFADKLGKNEDAAYYRELRKQAVDDFQKAYFNPENNVVATGSQASYAFALYFDLVPNDRREAAFENMLADVEKWNYRPSCGEVAWPFVIKTLSEFGRADVLWKMIQREDAPGYVHMLKKWGMKTLSETWDGPGSSMNHFMFGAIQEWFSSDIVGIRQSEDSVGYRESVLHPSPMIGKINKGKGDYRSVYGKIVSNWEVDESNGVFTWNVNVPTGTTARLEIPVVDESASVAIELVDGDKQAPLDFDSTYQTAKGENPSRRVVAVGSGAYRITSQLARQID